MVEKLQAGDPRSVGHYQLIGRLGGGGMGRVFLGRSDGGRLVAVKVIRPELAGEPGFRTRFAREVAAARNVSGLYTALVVDADTDGPQPWLATAYVAGPSLAEAVEVGGPLPPASVLTLAAGLAEGLQAIHAAEVVHRDLKPANVLLAHDGPRVIDFGIARAAEASVLTQSGMVVGSPGFMSPEQAEGREVGFASDVFSLGAVLAFAATGQGPFGTGSTAALIYRVVHGEPDLSGVPPEIRPLVGRCLAKDPGERPATAELLAEFSAGRLAADWLPASLGEILGRYIPPEPPEGRTGPDSIPAAGSADEPAVAMPAGPPTVTSARRRRTPTQAADVGPGAPGPRPPRRKRRYLLWMPAVAGLMAASAVAAVTVPGVLRNVAATQGRAAAGTKVTISPAPLVVTASSQGTATKSSAQPVTGTPSTSGGSSGTGGSTGTGGGSSGTGGSTGTGGGSSGTGGSTGTGGGSTGTGGSTAQPPQITSAQTYTQGVYVYISLNYTDPDNDAEGFGFVGANGSGWGEEQHPFSSPSYGTAGPGWIRYPFNQNCGNGQEYQSYVKAWIYDAEGLSSPPVILHLVCSY